jgi:multidrug efflux pump subunit AcrA (membrane-fusion protein)
MQKILGVLILTIFFFACNKGNETIKPAQKDIIEGVYASGIVKAENQYRVYALASGVVGELFVKEGDSIAVDAPILSLDNNNPGLNEQNTRIALELIQEELQGKKGRLKELELMVETAKERYLFDSIQYNRQQNLWKKSVGSQQDLDQRLLAFKASKKQYLQFKSSLQQTRSQLNKELQRAQNNLSISKNATADFIVRSRIDGKIYQLLKEPGEMVLPQEPVAVVGAIDKFIIELQIDEYDISKIAMGQKVLVNMDSYKGQVFEAKVSAVIPFMREASKTFTVEAIFTKPPPKLYPNLSLEANIIINEKQKAMTIPSTYLIQNKYVLTANKETLEVKIGVKSLEFVEITEGLDLESEIINPLQ